MTGLLTRETSLHVTSRCLLPVTDTPELRRYFLDAWTMRLQFIGSGEERYRFDAFLTESARPGAMWRLEHVMLGRRTRGRMRAWPSDGPVD